MPRIAAPTLAEHRDARRRDLLAAGAELMSRGQAVTMAAVADRAGVSRPAVYEYYASTEALVDAVADAIAQARADDAEAAMSTAGGPEPALRAYLEWAARLPGDDHAVARAERLLEPQLTSLAAALGAADPIAAGRMIRAVARSEGVGVDKVIAFVRAGITAHPKHPQRQQHPRAR